MGKKQLQALSGLEIQLADTLSVLPDVLLSFTGWQSSGFLPLEIPFASLLEAQEQIRRHGLPSEVVEAFAAVGQSDAIAEMTASVLNVDLTKRPPGNPLLGMAQGIPQLANEMRTAAIERSPIGSAAPHLRLDLDTATYSPGTKMTIHVAMRPGRDARPADAYLVVQSPTGAFFSLQLDGSLVPGIVPIARSIVPSQFDSVIARFVLTGIEPVGEYMWFAALMEPGTFNLQAPLVQTRFEVRR